MSKRIIHTCAIPRSTWYRARVIVVGRGIERVSRERGTRFLRVDHGSNFVFKEFFRNAVEENIVVLEAPVQSPNTMTHFGRYHAPLRISYEKIRSTLKDTDEEVL